MKTLTKVLLILLVSYFVAAANGAPLEVFVKIDLGDGSTIEGNSKDPKHLNEIKAVSFYVGVLDTGGFASGNGGGPAVRSLHR